MKKIITILLCLCTALGLVACGGTETPAAEKDYKLGMGIVVDLDTSETGNAQVDATVAAVVLDADGKIVSCRIDAVQNKMAVTNGAVNTAATFQTKMEKGDAYGMAAAINYGMDWNGDGVVKEWYDQAKAFEAYVVGKTAAQVEAIETQGVPNTDYIIAKDDALLSAGCTIQITDFIEAVAKACKDEQGMAFKTAKTFTLGVAATSFVDGATVAATAEANGVVAMYSDFACAVVAEGKVIATLNDAIQPKITINTAGEIVAKSYTATKRELKEEYGMAAAINYGMDWNGDGVVKEWYEQSIAFSNYVIGKTATEIADLATQEVPNTDYIIPADNALLSAGCTIQITSIKAVVAKSATNAR